MAAHRAATAERRTRGAGSITKAEEVAASIAGAIAITADVADETQVENLVARTVSTFGQLNVVVPNVRAVVSDMST